jgi:uncharacterized phage protein gp47/JayE
LADFLDFLPLFTETTDTIRARIDADMNAGVDPSDPNFADTTEGGIYFDITQTIILEIERIWDALAAEVPAVMFPAYTWGDYLDEWGITVNVPRKAAVAATGTVTFTGTAGTLIATGTTVSPLQTDPDVAPPSFVTASSAVIGVGGTVDVPIVAATPGVIGNVAAGTITLLLSPNAGLTALTNAAAMSGGEEVETDDAYRERILLEFSQSPGAGNQADYLRWALAYPGVGNATVQPVWAGAGTVRVIVTDADNNPVSGAVVSGLQALLDPTPGQGAGLAPIGAIVTVATPTPVTINISATVVHASGYSLDGTAGTVATRAAITQAIADYVGSLAPGDTVYLRHVEARFFAVQGVLDVTSLLLNGAASNVTIGGLQVADLGTVTLS